MSPQLVAPPRWRSRPTAALLLITLLGWSQPAWSTASYPAALARELELETTFECTLCHTTIRGGPGTARTPFAITLKSLGLEGRGNRETLVRALGALTDASPDSDEDGVSDLVELKAQLDPNVPNELPSMGGAPPIIEGSAGSGSVAAPGGAGPSNPGEGGHGPDVSSPPAATGCALSPSTPGGVSMTWGVLISGALVVAMRRRAVAVTTRPAAKARAMRADTT